MTNPVGWAPTSIHRVHLALKFSRICQTLNFLPMRFQGNHRFCADCCRVNVRYTLSRACGDEQGRDRRIPKATSRRPALCVGGANQRRHTGQNLLDLFLDVTDRHGESQACGATGDCGRTNCGYEPTRVHQLG